jgi:hypothetical protein
VSFDGGAGAFDTLAVRGGHATIERNEATSRSRARSRSTTCASPTPTSSRSPTPCP